MGRYGLYGPSIGSHCGPQPRDECRYRDFSDTESRLNIYSLLPTAYYLVGNEACVAKLHPVTKWAGQRFRASGGIEGRKSPSAFRPTDSVT